MKISPKVVIDTHNNVIREFIRRLVLSNGFDSFITYCIILNTIVLAIDWYSMPSYIDDTQNYINYCFAIIFGLESVLKVIGVGPRSYFRDTGNIFDFMVVVASVISSSLSIHFHLNFGATITFVRALKISRIMKYFRNARQVNIIYETLLITIPAITNVGGLMFLFLYIFSVLGVFLFAPIRLQEYLDVHANFQTFGYAFLTLFRCSTGE